MKITFLGTSHGVPAADRYCSSAMIEVNDSVYLIDAGAPVIDLLIRKGVDLNAVKAVFTTHLHGDHVFGVIQMASLFNWFFKTADADFYLTEQAGIDAIGKTIEVIDGPLCERVRLKLMNENTVYEDKNIRVTPFPTQHLAGAGRPAYSYLIEAGGKKVLFSGDLSVRLEQNDFPAYALENEVDLMICEMAHFGVEHVAPYLEKCKAKELLFNHVSPIRKLDEINALNGKYAYPIRTVDDGEEITL